MYKVRPVPTSKTIDDKFLSHNKSVLETQMRLNKLYLRSSQSELKVMSSAARPVHWLSLWKHMTYKKFVLFQSPKLFVTNFHRTSSQSDK